ncbi:MAG: hypothetical protein ACFFDY_01475 [Candidatus Thorarchaeota archaeon]
MARELGLNRSRITQLIKAGKITRDEDGYIDLDKNFDELAKRGGTGHNAHKLKTGPADSLTRDYVQRYHSARAKHEEMKAARAELQYKQEENELCSVVDVKKAAFEQGRKIRDALLMIKNKFADKETKKIVGEEINKILEDLVK